MTHTQAIAELNTRVRGWFGTADNVFGGHSLDEDRAREARKIAHASGVTLAEIEQIVDNFSNSNNLTTELREKNLKKVRKLFGTKLQ